LYWRKFEGPAAKSAGSFFHDGELRRIRIDRRAFPDWPQSRGSLAHALSFYLNIPLRKLKRDYEINEKNERYEKLRPFVSFVIFVYFVIIR